MAIFFFIWKDNESKPDIKIAPLEIFPIIVEKKEFIKKDPSDILSKLKIASKVSKEGLILSKEEHYNEALTVLKKNIEQQEKIKPIPVKVLKKEIKRIPKKVVPKKAIIKKLRKKENKKKEVIVHIKKIDVQKINKKTENKLSREEEVALYNKQYTDSLEVVNVSKNFELKEINNTLPDSYYFETIEPTKVIDDNCPLEFVKKMGVLDISSQYESSFTIPKKIEKASEGVIRIKNGSIETEEMRHLNFADKLGVLDISLDFESN